MITIDIPDYFNTIIPRIYEIIYYTKSNQSLTTACDCCDFGVFKLDKEGIFELLIILEHEETEEDITEAYIHLVYKGRFLDLVQIDDGNNYLLPPEEIDYSFDKVYELCDCLSSSIVKDGKCKNCYIYDYYNEDRCAVCFENNGRWCKLECGHTFHLHCVNELNKCPMCRSALNISMHYYPYY